MKYKGQECFIFGRRLSGYFDLRKLDGTVIHRSASYKELKLMQERKSLIMERRKQVGYPVRAIPPMTKVTGILAEK